MPPWQDALTGYLGCHAGVGVGPFQQLHEALLKFLCVAIDHSPCSAAGDRTQPEPSAALLVPCARP